MEKHDRDPVFRRWSRRRQSNPVQVRDPSVVDPARHGVADIADESALGPIEQTSERSPTKFQPRLILSASRATADLSNSGRAKNPVSTRNIGLIPVF
jgi:hypothetical protein